MTQFEKYKSILSSLENIKDINKIANLLNLDSSEIIVINNYFATLNLPRKIPYDDFITLLDDLNNLKYKEEIIENLHQLKNKTNDVAQINTIIRIANTKPDKYAGKTINTIKYKNKSFGIKQNCPHCGVSNITDYDTYYAICGYTDVKNGYNWEGCGRDWCTRCGKKLCKKWSENNLFIQENQFHDSKCCTKYSSKINSNYHVEFCQCYNNYVNRN